MGVFAQHQPIQDLPTNSLDHDADLISSSSPAPPVSFKLGRLQKGRARKGPRKKHPRPLPTPIRVSSPRPTSTRTRCPATCLEGSPRPISWSRVPTTQSLGADETETRMISQEGRGGDLTQNVETIS